MFPIFIYYIWGRQVLYHTLYGSPLANTMGNNYIVSHVRSSTLTVMSSRRSSLSSSGRSSPEPAAIDASRALILVNDDGFDGMTSAPFELYSDDEDDLDSPPYDIRHRLAYIQPLTPSAVFAYLLSPYLKLGAMLLPNTELPLNYGISSLVVFAILSALARHLWYMLSRYTRRADLEDIIAEVVAKGRGREDQRAVVRTVIRSITGLMRVLLGTLYLHGQHVVLCVRSQSLHFFQNQPA